MYVIAHRSSIGSVVVGTEDLNGGRSPLGGGNHARNEMGLRIVSFSKLAA